MKREVVEDALSGLNPDALFMDGLDEALVGYASQQTQTFLAVYSYNKIMEVLMRDGATYEDAAEYLAFNIEGAWVGENTPLILHEVEEDAHCSTRAPCSTRGGTREFAERPRRRRPGGTSVSRPPSPRHTGRTPTMSDKPCCGPGCGHPKHWRECRAPGCECRRRGPHPDDCRDCLDREDADGTP